MEISCRTAIRGIGVISLVLTLVSTYFLFGKTAALSTLQNSATLKLLLEMAMLTALLTAIFRYTGKNGKLPRESVPCGAAGVRKGASCSRRCVLILSVAAGYLWLHQILVPILAAVVYLGYLILLGAAVTDLFRGRCPAHEQNTAHEQRPVFGRCLQTGTGMPLFHKTGRDLLLGASLQLIITAAFSAAGKGGTGFLRIQCLLVFIPVLGLHIYRKTRQADPAAGQRAPAIQKNKSVTGENDSTIRESEDILLYLLPAMLIAGLLLQAGRMNIALDYDSLHYGLRSAFVLDNGAGIYQNLGSVNDVYVYPKGLETLCLPLSGLADGAFVTAVSWWLTVGSLWAVYIIAAGEQLPGIPVRREAMSGNVGKKSVGTGLSITGLCAAFCVCTIPGIMNMAVSAKTDAAALFFQLLCIAEFVRAFRQTSLFEGQTPTSVAKMSAFEKNTQLTGFLYGLAAAVFTLILKPTSYLFSLLPVLAALIAFLIQEKNRAKKAASDAKKDPEETSRVQLGAPVNERNRDAAEIQLSEQHRKQPEKQPDKQPDKQPEKQPEIQPGNKLGERFWAHAALVLTAAFLAFLLITLRTVILAGVPVTTAGSSLWKLFGFELKYPFAGLNTSGGESYSLIKRLIGVFACPVGEDMAHVYIAWGGLIPVLCITAAAVMAALRPKLSRIFLYLSMGLTLAASIGCIAALYQVDGNYFMLLYALAVICAFSGLSDAARKLLKALTPALALGALMCCITNWAGVPGLSELKLFHQGYVNRIELDREAQQNAGAGELYALLESDPTTRVLAMSEQPDCFVYRCNVQSYTDLEGSGGNVYLVKTLDLFKEYLDYAKEDYILTDDAFLAGHTRAADIVGYMLEDGSLTPLWEGAGKHLYKYENGTNIPE